MPATVKKKGGKYRVVEAHTGKLVMKDGHAVDGGGHRTATQARKQARAINANS